MNRGDPWTVDRCRWPQGVWGGGSEERGLNVPVDTTNNTHTHTNTCARRRAAHTRCYPRRRREHVVGSVVVGSRRGRGRPVEAELLLPEEGVGALRLLADELLHLFGFVVLVLGFGF